MEDIGLPRIRDDLIEPNDDCDLMEILKKYCDEIGKEDGCIVRFRAPFSLLPKHDARGDAITIIVDYLSQRGIPLWASHQISRSIADTYSSDLRTGFVPFVEDVMETIDAQRWYRHIFKSLNEYLMKIVSGEVDFPKKPESWDNIPFSHCAQRNVRSKMEDKDIVLPTLSVAEPTKHDVIKDDAFFAVFDGHNGVDCASYASSHFVNCLLDDTYYCDDDVEEVLRNAFDKLDKRIRARCRVNRIRGGAATVCALIRGRKKLCVAWCGDAAVAVLYPSSVKTLSTPHLPSNPEEARRVEEAGGVIVQLHGDLRVNGVLNITRSIGELDGRPMISHMPDTLSFDLDGSEYLLILACDGVWDVFDEEEVYNHIRNFVLTSKPCDYKNLGQYIVSRAKDAGSTDNLTAICAFLRPINDLWELLTNQEKVPAQ